MTVHSAASPKPIVRARAPLRLGLGGGGSDLSPYCDRFGGAVLNVTVDRFCEATIAPRGDRLVRFVARDSGRSWQGTGDEALHHPGVLTLHGGVYRRMVREFNGGHPFSIVMETSSDAPPGSGLGASSALVVTMVKACAQWLGLDLDARAIARLAFDIERNDLALAGGRQDQYAAALGGFNFIEFNAGEHVVVTPVEASTLMLKQLEESILLFDTGISRDSAAIIAEQQCRLRDDASFDATAAMHAIKAGAVRLRDSLRRGDFDAFYDIINQSWKAKKQTARMVSNGHIDRICDAALDAGASAAKVTGAGGGGFVLLFVRPERHARIVEALSPFGGEISPARFTAHGVRAWQMCRLDRRGWPTSG
jgi:D-glycero-alpha-D-manno-heptose-7-phosphate kinase